MIFRDFFHITRFPSHEVEIGNRPLGARNPIRIQSMTNTDTLDVKATIAQCIRIIEAGADYVRISAPNIKAAEALKQISKGIRLEGFDNPLVADIHFNADVALVAARYVEKVRINPGNYTGSSGSGKTEFTASDTQREKDLILERLKPLVAVCKEYGTAIRIGTNLGSLSSRIIHHYGNTPQGMVEATFEFLELFRELNFDQLVVSLKASKPIIMVQAYEGMVEKMMAHGMSYPLHIGITEAGEGENGRIKSALGMCTLLNKGIGDTIRVSLTEDPEKEIPFAIKITSLYQIPFTRSKDGDFYEFQKFVPNHNDITITDNKHKAIVICETDHSESEKDTPDSLSVAGHDAKSYEFSVPEADFYFTSDLQLILANPDKKFISPYKVIENLKPANCIPIIDYDGNHDQEIPAGSEVFFLRVCCKKFNNKPLWKDIKGLTGIILDLNLCVEEVDMVPWIDFSAENKIPVVLRKCFSNAETNDLITHLSIFAGSFLLEKKLQGIWISAPASARDLNEISFGILQSSGLRITKTEFISCPTCARTSFDLQKVLKDVQDQTSGFPGLKIAVMGCIVNGPGEMADADYGFVGTGSGKLHLYKGRKTLKKNIEPGNAAEELLEILRENGYTVGETQNI